MARRGQAPKQLDPQARPFRARSGDTLPDLIVPGLPPPGRALTGQRPLGYVPPARRRRRRGRRLLRRAAATLAALVLLAVAGFGVLLLIAPSAGQAARIAREHARAYGVPYPGPPVPPRFAAALTATEDHRFYSDPGVDPIAIGRVALGYLTGHGAQQGGATITQQLAKMLYTPNGSGVASVAEQVALAVKLNLTYRKPQILQMYAAVAYFGQDYYGLGAASCGYFAVPPQKLTWTQAALLAGLVQAPSAYDPLTHPVLAREREAHVLSRLTATGALTAAQAGAALAQPPRLVPRSLARAAPAPGTPTCGRTRT